MKCYCRRLALLFLVPALAGMISAIGCGGGESGGRKARSNASSDDTTVAKSDKSSKGSKSESEDTGETKSKSGGDELVAKSYGTLKGKVTYKGDPPKEKQIDIPTSVKERDQCLQGDTRVQTWKVGPDKGVGDVIVWLRAPKGKYFKIPADQQKSDPAVVKLDQPHCAFEPHVFVLYPSYYDPETKKQKSTGQVFEVVNSAPFNHNTNWRPSDELLNHGGNVILQAKSGKEEIKVSASKPSKFGGEQQMDFTCNIHPWMNAYARIFDHPYATVTSGDRPDDKDYGTYEIKQVPAGVEVELVYWHDSMKKPQVLKTVTLKDGDNTEDFSISAE